ncbi:uncharacterized protein LOC135153547 [Lytechinus pictus]|uniref:uncharacterized protein LOC135153547 n=1 Tax=Lytechinus pictus TaxID=7653 RepID=UPI0030B9E15F
MSFVDRNASHLTTVMAYMRRRHNDHEDSKSINSGIVFSNNWTSNRFSFPDITAYTGEIDRNCSDFKHEFGDDKDCIAYASAFFDEEIDELPHESSKTEPTKQPDSIHTSFRQHLSTIPSIQTASRHITKQPESIQSPHQAT